MSQQIGHKAESQACEFLMKQGLQLLQKNYQCRAGEIDLIMRDKETIVFVEVRYRHRSDYGSALESITPSKVNKIVRAATYYLQLKKCLYKVPSRFDIVIIQSNNKKLPLDWIKNAFYGA